jgi:hypothetical protein
MTAAARVAPGRQVLLVGDMMFLRTDFLCGRSFVLSAARWNLSGMVARSQGDSETAPATGGAAFRHETLSARDPAFYHRA